VGLVEVGKTPVHNLHLFRLVIEEHIPRLDVSVHDSLRVCII
jgi:hypothetical protein